MHNRWSAAIQSPLEETMKVIALLIALTPLAVFGQVGVPPPPGPAPAGDAAGPADQEGMETLTRGPIHEAFADPAIPDPKPSPVVPDKPPPDVPEQPPDYQPEGNYLWIPGYYEWDEDRRGFIWVTGVWRQPPPGKRWMEGYWHEVDGGWQRVRGFWIDDEVEHVSYQATPPPNSLDTGPSSPQPADDHFWIPGNWNYVNANYVWQAGYWAPYQPNWVWVPARWLWTPAGYVFAPGYWDYRLANRGQIFAPVYFSSAIYTRPGWFYRPTVVIPTSNLFITLWLRPSYGSYYFGNYFGPQYASLGFMPWVNIGVYQRQRYFYDPFYSYAAVHYRRQGVDFLGRTQGWHQYYAEHPNDRPPATWREQQRWLASRPASAPAITTQLTAHHITEVARQTDSPLKLKKIDEHTLQTQVEHAKQLREVDGARRNLEREHAHVTTRLPTADSTVRNLDQSKTAPLLDRIDKKGKTGGDDGAKAVDTKVGDTKVGETVKLNLPKVKLPTTAGASTGTTEGTSASNTTGNVIGAVPRNLAPPLPLSSKVNTAAQGNVTTQGNTRTPRANVLPNTNKTGTGNVGKAGTGNVGPANAGPSNIGPAKIGRDNFGQGNTATGNKGNTGQGNVRGKTSGNVDSLPKGLTPPAGGFEPQGSTNRGGQSPIRNVQPPGGDSKGGARIDNSRAPGKATGQNEAGGGNTGNANSPPGGKGKKKDQ